MPELNTMLIPRMTTRRWMAAVAVVAILSSVAVGLARRRGDFQQRAAGYARASDEASLRCHAIENRYLHWRPSVPELAEMEALDRQRDYFAELKRKYEHAAARPWLPVEPDPPGPE